MSLTTNELVRMAAKGKDFSEILMSTMRPRDFILNGQVIRTNPVGLVTV